MPIHINQEKQEFHLYNDDISYIVAILPNGQVYHHYFGKRVHLEDSFAYLQERDYRSLTVYPSESDPTFSLQHTRKSILHLARAILPIQLLPSKQLMAAAYQNLSINTSSASKRKAGFGWFALNLC